MGYGPGSPPCRFCTNGPKETLRVVSRRSRPPTIVEIAKVDVDQFLISSIVHIIIVINSLRTGGKDCIYGANLKY